jgi:ribosomal protein S27E
MGRPVPEEKGEELMELCPKCEKHAAVLDHGRMELQCKQFGCCVVTPVVDITVFGGQPTVLPIKEQTK